MEIGNEVGMIGRLKTSAKRDKGFVMQSERVNTEALEELANELGNISDEFDGVMELMRTDGAIGYPVVYAR
jgi:hypothetical protein